MCDCRFVPFHGDFCERRKSKRNINTYIVHELLIGAKKLLIDYCRQSINGIIFTVQIEKCILTFYTAD